MKPATLAALLLLSPALPLRLAAAQSTKISGPLAHAPGTLGGDVRQARYSPDGSRLLYLADQETVGAVDLYSVPVGGGPAVRLSAAFDHYSGVGSFEISADGARVAFVTLDAALFTVPATGGAATQLAAFAQVFRLSADGTRIVFTEGQLPFLGGPDELRVAPLDGSAPSTLLDPLPSDIRSLRLELAPDGSRAVYTTETQSSATSLHSVPLDGSAASVQLVGSVLSFQVSPDSARAVFVSPDGAGGAGRVLASRRLDGSANANLLATTASELGLVQVDPSGTRVVFTALGGPNSVNELFSVPIDASSAPVRLSEPVAGFGGIQAFPNARPPVQITPDGARVVYRANQGASDALELFLVPIGGGAVTRLSGPLVPGGNVQDFLVSPDSIGVVFSADAVTDNETELFGASFAGGGRFQLSTPQPSTPPFRAVSSFQISPDDLHVVYQANFDVRTRLDLYRVAITGGASTRLTAAAPQGGLSFFYPVTWSIQPGSTRVAYLADALTAGQVELFQAPIRGGLEPVRMNGELAAGPASGDVRDLRVAPDGQTMVYAADGEVDERVELYRTTVHGGAVTRLTGPFVAGGSVLVQADAFRLTADGTQVLYLADQDTLGIPELYRVPLDGSTGPVKLNHALTISGATGGVRAFELSSDGVHVLYRAHRYAQFAELYSARLDGAVAPVRLSLPGQNTFPHSTTNFPQEDITLDGTRVVYRTDAEIYSAPIDGSRPAVRLGAFAELAPYNSFALSSDGRWVAISGRAAGAGTLGLFVTSIDGRGLGAGLTRLDERRPGRDVAWSLPFRFDRAGKRVLYGVDSHLGFDAELDSAPLEGARNARTLAGATGPGRVLLHGPTVWRLLLSPSDDSLLFLLSSGDLERASSSTDTAPVRVAESVNNDPASFAFSPDGQRALYASANRLESVLLDGSLATAFLNRPREYGYNPPSRLRAFATSPDGRWVVFQGDETQRERDELYASPSDGSVRPVSLSGPFLHDDRDESYVAASPFAITPDSRFVVYVDDQDADGIDELYASPLP